MPGTVEELETLLVKVVTDAVKFTEGMAGVDREVNGFMNKYGNVTVNMTVNLTQFEQGIRQATSRVRAATKDMAAAGAEAGAAYADAFQKAVTPSTRPFGPLGPTYGLALPYYPAPPPSLPAGMAFPSVGRIREGGPPPGVPYGFLGPPLLPRYAQPTASREALDFYRSLGEGRFGGTTRRNPYLGFYENVPYPPRGITPPEIMAALTGQAATSPASLAAALYGNVPAPPRMTQWQRMLNQMRGAFGLPPPPTGGPPTPAQVMGALYPPTLGSVLGAGAQTAAGGGRSLLGMIGTGYGSLGAGGLGAPGMRGPFSGLGTGYGLLGNLFLSRLLFRFLGGLAAPGLEYEEQLNRAMIPMGVAGQPGAARALTRTVTGIAQTSITSPLEQARGLEILAKSGFDVAESQRALVTAEKFAVATHSDLESATTRLLNVQESFGLKSADAGQNQQNLARTANVLTEASNMARTSVLQLAEGLERRAGTAARQLGINMEGVAAMMVVFANHGFEGTQAANLTSTALVQLQRASITHRAEWAKMNIALFDGKGQFRGMEAVLGDMEKRFAGLTPQARRSALQFLGLSDMGIVAVDTLRGFSKELGDLHDHFEETGDVLDKQYKQVLGATANQFKILENSMRAVGVEVLGFLRPALGVLIEGAQAVIGWWNGLDTATKSLVVGFVVAAAAISAAVAILTSAVLAFGVVAGAVGAVLNVIFAPATLVIVAAGVATFAIVAAVLAYGDNWERATKFFNEHWRNLKGFFYNFRENMGIITDWLYDNWRNWAKDTLFVLIAFFADVQNLGFKTAVILGKTMGAAIDPRNWGTGFSGALGKAFREALTEGDLLANVKAVPRTTAPMKPLNFAVPLEGIEEKVSEAAALLGMMGSPLGTMAMLGAGKANQVNMGKFLDLKTIPGESKAIATIGLAMGGPLAALGGLGAQKVPPPFGEGNEDFGKTKGKNVFEEINLRRFALEGPGGLTAGNKEMKDDIKSIAHSSGKTEEHLAKILEKGGFGVVGRGAGRR